MTIIRIGESQAAEGKAEALFDFLKSLIPYISSSEGCLSCEVLRHSEHRDKFMVIERWQSIEFHKKSIEAFSKEDIQAAMSLFAAPPKGDYYHN